MIMNESRTSDASTSTDDAMKGRPLCLFYFTHPFGVLSPEPPTVVIAPRATDEPRPADREPSSDVTSARRGAVGPLDVMAARRCTLDLGSASDALSSSFFTGDVQFGWSSDSTGPGRCCARRAVPYGRTLPPLRLPAPRGPSAREPRPTDLWPTRLLDPERISLPPIEMPTSSDTERVTLRRGRHAGAGAGGGGGAACTPRRAGAGVRKPQARRGPEGAARRSGARAALVRLLRRAITGSEVERDRGALVAALAAAWRPPDSARSSSRWEPSAAEPESRAGAETARDDAMAPAGRAAAAVPPPPPPPHRRYSVPETVMRKYNLARQRSDLEETALSCPSPCPAGSPRRSAVLRRLWGPASPSPAPLSPCRCGRGTDSAPHHSRRPSYAERCDRFASRPFRLYDFSTRESRTDDATVAQPYDSPTTDVPPTDTPPTDALSHCVSSPTVEPQSPCALLEIVVSEAVRAGDALVAAGPRPPPRGPLRHTSAWDVNIDEYVSDVLVESLNSLSDRLETVTASLVGDGRISIVEKEIKVRLQNTGVNTIVHLSPTSNNQIIFGNEELYERDACVYPRLAADASRALDEEGDRAALCRLRRLFRDELPPADPPAPRWVPSRPASGPGVGRNSRGASPCASLVDSLDSPRVPPRSSPSGAAPTTPPRPPPQRDKGEAFFVRIKDDDSDSEEGSVVVADHMPESLKRRLHRRHRRRELRMECARRGRAELEARRTGDAGEERRGRGARVAFEDVAKVARNESRRAPRHPVPTPPPESEDDASRVRYRNGRSRRSTASGTLGDASIRSSPDAAEADQNRSGMSAGSPPERGPRRLYHKSEICDGGECIEILEIVEYATASRSSSETVSEEGRCVTSSRRSRIPVPVKRAPPAGAETLVRVPAPAPQPPPQPPCAPPEHRARSHSLRFERVFDVIPEERGVPGTEPCYEAPPRPRRPAEPPPPGTIGSSGGGSVGSGGRRGAARLGVAGGESGGRGAPPPRGAALVPRPRVAAWRPPPAPRTCDETSGCAGASSGDSDSPARADRRARAPRWPAVPRARRRLRRVTHSSRRSTDTGGVGASGGGAGSTSTGAGGWSVTVAGSGGAALPADVEMRLRFPPARHSRRPAPSTQEGTTCSACSACSSCACRRCAGCGASARPRTPPPPRALACCERKHGARDVTPPARRHPSARRRAVRSPLPALAAPAVTPAAARHSPSPRTPEATLSGSSHVRRRPPGRSPRAAGAPAAPRSPAGRPRPRRRRPPVTDALSVLGCAIVPEAKPRAPTMSERDLTRRRRDPAPTPAPAPRCRHHAHRRTHTPHLYTTHHHH